MKSNQILVWKDSLLLLFALALLPGIASAQMEMKGMNMAKTSPIQHRIVSGGQRVVYDLNIADTSVNYTGKRRHALAINGLIPGPTIELTEGDTAVLRVHNHLKGTASIHWHGILIPNKYDGVPGLNTFPVESGKTLEVVFPVLQSGTYWYHSHTMYQEQIGLTGSIVIHKRNERKMKEEVIVLNDWTNQNPWNVFRLLKRGTDWYSIRKHSVQSYGEALQKKQLGDKFYQEWRRMPAMDISDVKYAAFHVNGAASKDYSQYKAGDQIKLRLINASSASYFWLQFAGGKMQVVAADGQDVKPVEVDKFLIATAETYDVIITLPADGRYELRATAQDISGTTSAFFGTGNKVEATTIPKVDYFKIMAEMNGMMKSMPMKMGTSEPATNVKTNSMAAMPEGKMKMGGMKGMHHHGMKMGGMDMGSMKMMPMYGFDFPPGDDDTGEVLSYKMLKAENNDNIPTPQGKPDRIIKLTATGNMFRYVWAFNNKTLSAADKILIKKGEHVRVIFQNNTMMEHPLHLHGHFFRFANGSAMDDAPMKHTFNLMPMATDTIDFAADEEQDWFFHCHTLYHMMAGMARVFHYDSTVPVIEPVAPKLFHHFLREHGRHIFPWGEVMAQSQGAFGNFTLAGTTWELNEEANWDWNKRYESETILRRFIDQRQFLSVFIGADNRREWTGGYEKGEKKLEHVNLATAGLTYFLPFFITAEGRIDHKGHLRLQLARQDLALSSRARFDFSVNTDKEYMFGLKYILTKNLAVSGSYDSDYGWGAGLSFIY